jgi:hypothetical protein
MFSSHLMNESYPRILPDYNLYRTRSVTGLDENAPATGEPEVAE